jgi:hypothetical protein
VHHLVLAAGADHAFLPSRESRQKAF